MLLQISVCYSIDGVCKHKYTEHTHTHTLNPMFDTSNIPMRDIVFLSLCFHRGIVSFKFIWLTKCWYFKTSLCSKTHSHSKIGFCRFTQAVYLGFLLLFFQLVHSFCLFVSSGSHSNLHCEFNLKPLMHQFQWIVIAKTLVRLLF